MNRFKETYIRNYFQSRGWTLTREGGMFCYFRPPENLSLPEGFEIEIPKDRGNSKGFDNYIKRLIDELIEIFQKDSNYQDLEVLFSKENSILKYRIFDADNENGSISFQKHLNSLDVFKNVLSQAVIFTATKKPIFGDAKFEVESYLNRCRALQTEKGSYVTRLEIPNDVIYTTISAIETKEINNKLFDSIEYIDQNIFNAKSKIEINENYLSDMSSILNFELFDSIKNIYSKTEINNIEFQLSSNSHFRKIETKRVQQSIPYFKNYLKEVKNLLLEVVPLEAIGYVKRLYSSAPLSAPRNEVTIDAEISGSVETIKLILRSEEYIEAIEAHKHEWPIRIKGKAKQYKTMLSIQELDEFEVLTK